MTYVDGFVAAVPTANKEQYIKHASDAAVVFKDHGALKLVECWGDDVPDGEVTSFPMAVKCKPDETVVFSWILWPSREARNRGMPKVMEDPRIQADVNPMPFADLKRLWTSSLPQPFQRVLDGRHHQARFDSSLKPEVNLRSTNPAIGVGYGEHRKRRN